LDRIEVATSVAAGVSCSNGETSEVALFNMREALSSGMTWQVWSFSRPATTLSREGPTRRIP
jgi:hypothetical protein